MLSRAGVPVGKPAGDHRLCHPRVQRQTLGGFTGAPGAPPLELHPGSSSNEIHADFHLASASAVSAGISILNGRGMMKAP